MRIPMLLIATMVGALIVYADDSMITEPFGATGSVSFSQDGLKYLSQDKALLGFVTNSLDVQEVGKCQLMLSGVYHDPPIPPALIPPYEFMAKAKGSSGPYNLRLILPMQIGSITNVPSPKIVIESKRER